MIGPKHESAFPYTYQHPTIDPHTVIHHGMTLRDWFAGQALSAMNGQATPGEKAFIAYAIADAMLLARSKPAKEKV
jgi:hypothetical protein